MSDELLASLKADREKALKEVEKIDAFIADLEGQKDDGVLTTPLAPFLKEKHSGYGWLFQGLIPTGATCIMAGEGKIAGKSTLLIQMSLCLAVGRSPFYECPVPKRAKTLYVSAEGARAMLQERVATAARALGIHPDDASGMWCIQKQTASDYMLGSRGLEKMIDQSGAQMVVLDTLKYFHRGNNNDATDFVRHVMDPIRRLTGKYGCAFVLVDHQTKPSPERKGIHKIGGTASKKDDTDIIMQLEPPPGEETTDKRTLWLTSKYAAGRRWDLKFDMANARFG